MLPLYTRYLTRADYGVLELLDLIWTLAALLVSVHLSGALFYYYHLANSETERRRDLVTALLGTLLIGLMIGIAGLAAAPSLSSLVFGSTDYTGLVRVTLLGLGCNLPAEFGLALLRLLDRPQTYLLITIGRLIANISINVSCLVYFGIGVATMPWSSLITTAILAVACLAWTLATYSVRCFDWSAFARMFWYGLPLGLSTAGEVILHFGDRLFLSQTLTLGDLGLYGLAYKLGMIVAFAALPFFQFWNAQMVGIVRMPGGDRAYVRGATYLLGGLVAVVLNLTAFINPLLEVIAGPEFRGAGRFVPWIALAYLVRAMGSYWSNTFLLIGRPALVAQMSWLGAISCLVGYAVLIPRLGITGAVVATHLGFGTLAFFSLWLGQRLRRFDYEYGRWAKVVVCGMLSTIPLLDTETNVFVDRLARGLLCVGLFPSLLVLSKFLTPDEVRFIIASGRRLIGLVIPQEVTPEER